MDCFIRDAYHVRLKHLVNVAAFKLKNCLHPKINKQELGIIDGSDHNWTTVLRKILALDWPVPETVCTRHYTVVECGLCLKEDGFGRKTGFAVNLASHLKSALNLFLV